jgi:hypothetical protein
MVLTRRYEATLRRLAVRSGLVLLVVLIVCCDGLRADDGKLEQVRSEVRTSSPDSPSGSGSKSSSSSSDDDDDQISFEFCKALFCAPFTIPHACLHDDFEVPATFLAYPYSHAWSGVMQPGMDKKQIDGVTPATWERLWTLRTTIEDGNDFNGLNRLSVLYLADTVTRFGIGGRFDFFDERQSSGGYDHLTLADTNLLFRFAQSEKTQFRAGIGARFMHDRDRTDAGINLVYGFEYFPKDPYTIRAQVEGGNLNHAGVFRVNAAVGVAWNRLEAQLGYDYLQIGSAKLQGPFVGLRFWF